MFQSVEIKGYRGLDRLTMSGLGRINLLVGTNNSGKTSVLEALYLLASDGDLGAIWEIQTSRGERFGDLRGEGDPPEIEVCHLFHGHDLNNFAQFTVSGAEQDVRRRLHVYVDAVLERNEAQVKFSFLEDEREEGVYLVVRMDDEVLDPPHFPLTERGGISLRTFQTGRHRSRRNQSGSSARYISTGSLSPLQLHELWNGIVLTEGEDQILDALRAVEPKIERIAPLTAAPSSLAASRRGGFVVKIAGNDVPVPIGSLGDGIWRMLSMALALVRAKDGVLLVDEIDTGLHYTVMDKMWTLIAKTAEALNVQVFATTHSQDCVHSLASICRRDVEAGSRVTIQRIEPGQQAAVPYSEAEITVAAERRIEVR
ncbi:AAA family ATPase [Azospirillum thermophilum]|uniref:Chromosome segregation protein SMC n=1 Tax=Azospirillum thermophilum TaxID=2202148 RepID=A0A2S2CKE0_9PROT|nr:ATP/GTP-binding protein [Azospirillum thermophilum]AWK84899.1 chromosome segregation protein SMC [Azospirillum thermophilum]